MIVGWLVAACTEPDPPPPADTDTETIPTTPVEPEPLEIPLASLPLLVGPEDGYVLDTVASFGDVDADGILDAVVGAFDGDSVWRLYVVRGPLGDDLVPRDAWLVVDPTAFIVRLVRDHTGDGIGDVWVRSSAYSPYGRKTWIAPTPWDGTLVPTADWLLLDDAGGTVSHAYDVNGDGVVDQVASVVDGLADHLDITYGPNTRWSGPPDVSVTPMCTGPSAYPLWQGALPSVRSFPGDLDGDGTPEISISRYAFDAEEGGCGEFTVSLPAEGGDVDPFVEATAGRYPGLVTEALPVGDLTGDGLPELWEPVYGALWSSPNAITATEIAPGAVTVADPDITLVLATGVDLDGDGRPNALAEVARPDGEPLWVVLPSDPAGWASVPDGTPGWAVDFPGPVWADPAVHIGLWDASAGVWRRADLGAPR